jgi:hypothetical protein
MQQFREQFQAPFFYGYYIEKTPLEDFPALMIFLLIEEFILLN